MKKLTLAALSAVVLVIAAAAFSAAGMLGGLQEITGECDVSEITFYYSDSCSWCQKVKNEGGLLKLAAYGVSVNNVNTARGPILHDFTAVPTFVVNEEVHTGYKTFEELKELLNCRVLEEV